MSQAAKLIFVYGTLKRGGSNQRYLANQKFLGEARSVPGYRLHDLGSYPGMIPHPQDCDGVTGEVWSVDAAALMRLDQLEGVAEGLYRREPVLLLAPFADHAVETYISLHDAQGRPEVGPTWKE